MVQEYRYVKFLFETSNGPGSITVGLSEGITIEQAKVRLLDTFKDLYQHIEIVGYEIIRE